MKKERVLTTFECDNCKKKSSEREKGMGFPYDLGWIYIYEMKFKISKNKHESMEDKHFCNKECFIMGIKKKLGAMSEGCCACDR